MHFGENQLSPRSVGISPLSTGHPPVLQHWWVRASTALHCRFTLPMDSSRGFGSVHRYCPTHAGSRPLQTRFPSGSPALPLVNLCNDEPLAGSFYKRHAISPYSLLGEWPLTACEYEVSGSLSSPSRGAFHLSLTVLVHYRSLKVFSLGGWSPLLPTNSPGFVVLRIPAVPPAASSTGLSPSLGGAFQRLRVRHLALSLVLQPHRFRKTAGLGSSRLARHYDGNLV